MLTYSESKIIISPKRYWLDWLEFFSLKNFFWLLQICCWLTDLSSSGPRRYHTFTNRGLLSKQRTSSPSLLAHAINHAKNHAETLWWRFNFGQEETGRCVNVKEYAQQCLYRLEKLDFNDPLIDIVYSYIFCLNGYLPQGGYETPELIFNRLLSKGRQNFCAWLDIIFL